MGLLGKLVSLPIRIVNIPARAIDSAADLMCGGDGHPTRDERVLSVGLDAFADFVETVLDDVVGDE